MPLLEHLRELRNRIVYAGVAWGLATVVCLYWSNFLIDAMAAPVRLVLADEKRDTPGDHFYAWLTEPMHYLPGWDTMMGQPVKGHLTVIHALEGFYAYMYVGLIAGAVIASPVIAYQIWKFVAPGLYTTERKYVFPLSMASAFLFVLGCLFGYVLVVPISFKFFVSVVNAEPLLSMNDALATGAKIVLSFGLCYQLPIVCFVLARVGWIDARDMIAWFRYAVVGIFILSALLTPPDVFSQTLLAIPLLLLYGVSIVVVKVVSTKVRLPPEALDDASEGS